LQPGAKIGGYEIVGPLGAGGMGEVYRAHDSKLRRDVAIKVLPQSLSADPDRLARLTREARMLAALNHPNIAAIYGLDDSSGVTALVMELVGVSELFAQPFSPPGAAAPRGGGRVLVSNGGGTTPHWRGDGKELLYLAPDGALMAAECVTTDAPRCSAPRSLFKVPGVQSGWGVSPDGSRFLFAVSSGTSEPEPFSVILNWIATLPASRP
jgi:hypothetical protein